MEGNALRALGTYAGEPRQLVDQVLDRACVQLTHAGKAESTHPAG